MSPVDYALSKHAQDVIARRNIPESWIREVLERPAVTESDDCDPELEHRLGRIAEYQNRVLRVVINGHVSPVRVVTAYFDRKVRRRL